MIKSSVRLVFVFLTCIGALHAAQASDADSAAPQCQEIQLVVDTAPSGEKEALRKYPKKFSRQGSSLTLYPTVGKPQHFTDHLPENGADRDLRHYSFFIAAYFESFDAALIAIDWDESTDFTLVSMRTGKNWRASGEYEFSPNKQRIAFIEDDIGPVTSGGLLAIFSLTNGDLVEEYRVRSDEWWPQDLSWKSDTLIEYVHCRPQDLDFCTRCPKPSADNTRQLHLKTGGIWAPNP